MQRVERDERRASLVALHHLNRSGASFAGVAGDMVGLHSSDPASVFMGDVGSLALGGGLGMLAVLTKNPGPEDRDRC